MKNRYLITIMLSAWFAFSAPGIAQENATNSRANNTAGVAIQPVKTIPQNPNLKLPPASTKPNITYAVDIKPILDANCVRCHITKQAKLHLDSRDAILQGADNNPVVIPGSPKKSWLVNEIVYSGNDTNSNWMPPQHTKAKLKSLSPEQIGLIIGWIQQGAN
jgi:hypothetical protein